LSTVRKVATIRSASLLFALYAMLMIAMCTQSIFIHWYKISHASYKIYKDRYTHLRISNKQWSDPNCVRKVEDYEISYFGQMFDISGIEYKSDSVFISGHFDKKENMLLEGIQHERNKSEQLSSFQGVLFFNENLVEFQIQRQMTFSSQEFNQTYNSKSLLNPFLENFEQPPEIA
jgi:hypothetical protein